MAEQAGAGIARRQQPQIELGAAAKLGHRYQAGGIGATGAVLDQQLQAGALLKHEHQLQCQQPRRRTGITIQLQRTSRTSHPQSQTAGRSSLI